MLLVVHIRRLQRLRTSLQDAFEERELFDNLMRVKVAMHENAVRILDYFGLNTLRLLRHLITKGELDLLLSPRGISVTEQDGILVDCTTE